MSYCLSNATGTRVVNTISAMEALGGYGFVFVFRGNQIRYQQILSLIISDPTSVELESTELDMSHL